MNTRIEVHASAVNPTALVLHALVGAQTTATPATPPSPTTYVVIEGVYVTEPDDPTHTSGADEATDVFEEQRLDVAAGVRQPMQDYVTASGRRILEPPFMEINQAVGLPRGIDPRARGGLGPRGGPEEVGIHRRRARPQRDRGNRRTARALSGCRTRVSASCPPDARVGR